MQRRRPLVADLQLAGEGRLLDDAEHEAEHVVEQPGDDAAVGPSGRALVGGPSVTVASISSPMRWTSRSRPHGLAVPENGRSS